MKPFCLQAALSGAKLVTRSELPVNDFQLFQGNLYQAKVNGGVWGYDQAGRSLNSAWNFDIFLAAEPAAPNTRTMWVNVYQAPDGFYFTGHRLHESKESALLNKAGECFATLPIEIPQP